MIRCLARRSTRSDSFKRSCRVSRLTRERTPKSQFGKHRRPTMGNDVAKKPENELCNLDGFDGFTDETEGEDEQSSGSLIVGTKIKFDEAQVWVDSNGKKLPAGLELVFIKVRRVVRKWGPDNKSIEGETKILEPHEKWPDFDALNAKCPKSQWHEAFGKIRGPYRGQRLVYLEHVPPQLNQGDSRGAKDGRVYRH